MTSQPQEPQSVPIPSNDQAIWLAYAAKIKSQLVGAGKLDADQRLYICPPSKVFGGSCARAQEVFNKRIHDYANSLLKPDGGPFYTKSNIDYVWRLTRWVEFIKPDFATASDEIAMKAAEDDLHKRKDAWTDIEQKSEDGYQVYVRDCIKSKIDPESIETWRTSKFSEYSLYRSGWVKAASEVEYLRKKYYGEALGKIQARLNQAQDSGKYFAGITMPMTVKPFDAGKKIPPMNLSYRPEWSFGDFFGSLEEIAKIGVDEEPEMIWDISASKVGDFKWSKINVDDKAEQSGSDLFLVVSKSSTNEHSNEIDEGMSSVLDDVTFNLKFQAIRSYDISAGDWNTGDLSNYNVMPGVQFEDFIQPTSILIGFGPSLDVKFGDKSKDTFEKSYDSVTTSKDTGLRVLGMQITGPREARTEEDRSSQGAAHYDKSTGISIKPPKQMFPVVLGILGSKISLPTKINKAKAETAESNASASGGTPATFVPEDD